MNAPIHFITVEFLDRLIDTPDWEPFCEFLKNTHTVRPVAPNYPEDGTCEECGSNRWDMWPPCVLCTVCGHLDA